MEYNIYNERTIAYILAKICLNCSILLHNSVNYTINDVHQDINSHIDQDRMIILDTARAIMKYCNKIIGYCNGIFQNTARYILIFY